MPIVDYTVIQVLISHGYMQNVDTELCTNLLLLLPVLNRDCKEKVEAAQLRNVYLPPDDLCLPDVQNSPEEKILTRPGPARKKKFRPGPARPGRKNSGPARPEIICKIWPEVARSPPDNFPGGSAPRPHQHSQIPPKFKKIQKVRNLKSGPTYKF